MEKEAIKSKLLYKALLISLKIIPMIVAFCYMLNTAFAYLDIDTPVLSNLAGYHCLHGYSYIWLQ